MTENHRDYDGSSDPASALGPTDVSELVGWQPHLPPPSEPGQPREVTVGMSDEQILAHYRHRYRNPYMTMGTATALHRLHWQNLHLRAAHERAREEEQQEVRRRLREIVNRKP
jgi:hypothetical protein